MKKFTETTMYKKGDIGEKIVDDIIENNPDILCYAPITDGSHPVDRIVMSRDKREMMIVEVKTLNARDFYPDTGISIDHYNQYKYLQEKYCMNVQLVFVDERKGKVYGNLIDELDKEIVVKHNGRDIVYPHNKYNSYATGEYIRYFALDSMKEIRDLTEEEILEIRKYSNRRGA